MLGTLTVSCLQPIEHKLVLCQIVAKQPQTNFHVAMVTVHHSNTQ